MNLKVDVIVRLDLDNQVYYRASPDRAPIHRGKYGESVSSVQHITVLCVLLPLRPQQKYPKLPNCTSPNQILQDFGLISVFEHICIYRLLIL